jgi:hypothetical protein
MAECKYLFLSPSSWAALNKFAKLCFARSAVLVITPTDFFEPGLDLETLDKLAKRSNDSQNRLESGTVDKAGWIQFAA